MQIMYLSELNTGESAVITRVLGGGAFRKRITEMGFIKGKKVKVIKNAPLNDPIEYEIMGYNVSLRRSEARMVEVVAEPAEGSCPGMEYNGTSEEDSPYVTGRNSGRIAEKQLYLILLPARTSGWAITAGLP